MWQTWLPEVPPERGLRTTAPASRPVRLPGRERERAVR